MHKFSSFGSKKAFSLAEVTIILAVIGVIATLSIGVLKFTEKSQYPTLRAVFKNDLATSLASMNTEESLSSVSNTADLVKKIEPYYDLKNTCNKADCFANQYKDAAGNVVNIKDYDYTFKTANGTSVMLSYVNTGVDLGQFAAGSSNINKATEAYEISNAAMNFVTGVFDVNGPKGPNKIGEDMGLITPAFALNKKAGEYLSIDSTGAFVIKSAKGSSDDTTIVDPNGKFTNPGKDPNIDALAKGENYRADEYGNAVCILTRAKCAADGNKKLNKSACTCEYNISCPKNQIQDASGNCVCKTPDKKCGPYARYGTEGQSESCSCECELGGALRCMANGGSWDEKTCSCNCGGDATNKCKAAVSNGYAVPDPNNYCACTCKSEAEVTALIGSNSRTLYSPNLQDKCFVCKTPENSDIQPVRDDSKGICLAECSPKSVTEIKRVLGFFYGAHEGYDTQNVPDVPGACDAFCKTGDLASHCSGAPTNVKKSSCPTLNMLHGYGVWTGYSCDTSGIRFTTDEQNCRCSISYPRGLITRTISLEKACHCGNECSSLLTRYRCTYTPKFDYYTPNKNNGHPNNANAIYGVVQVREFCQASRDPILLVIPSDGNPAKSVNPSVNSSESKPSVKLTASSKALKTNWLANPTEHFLLVKPSTKVGANLGADKNMKDVLFTDIAYDTGLVELQKDYDSASDGVINELDSNFANFKLWLDKNGNAKVESGELYTLADKNITEISTSYEIASDISGEIEQSASAITAVKGGFEMGVAKTSNYSKWFERVKDKDANNNDVIAYKYDDGTYTYYYTFNKVYSWDIIPNKKYSYYKLYKKVTNADNAVEYVQNGEILTNTSEIGRYFKKNGNEYEIKEFRIIDIFFYQDEPES